MPETILIKEVRHVPANTWVHEEHQQNGLRNSDNIDFQFQHTRSLVIVQSAIGLVAVVPVCMGHISSVQITAEEQVQLRKGEEFGFLAFDGSNIIIIF